MTTTYHQLIKWTRLPSTVWVGRLHNLWSFPRKRAFCSVSSVLGPTHFCPVSHSCVGQIFKTSIVQEPRFLLISRYRCTHFLLRPFLETPSYSVCVCVDCSLCPIPSDAAKPGRGGGLPHTHLRLLLLPTVKGNGPRLDVTKSEIRSLVKGQRTFSQFTIVWNCEETEGAIAQKWQGAAEEGKWNSGNIFVVLCVLVTVVEATRSLSPETGSVVLQMIFFCS